MTRELQQQLAELVQHFTEVGTAAALGSKWMGAHDVPIERCIEANTIAKLAFQLATALDKLARDNGEK